MHWENNTEDFPDIAETEIPTELLDGLERLAEAGDLLKARLRWRPLQTTATGFLTKDRLLELRGESVYDVALALASHACHLHDQGGCEPKFEAQVQREIEAAGPERGTEREWRSITFYVHQTHPEPEPRPSYTSYDVRDDDDDDYLPSRRSSALEDRPSDSMMPAFRTLGDVQTMFRDDPAAMALVMSVRASERSVMILERLLMSSVSRLDRVLGSQVANSRYLNEALQTLTRGAADVSRIGVDLFNQGLESQARVARMEHETELGKERTEVLREAVKHGSLLIQAVLMSQQAKHQQRTAQPAAANVASPQPAPAPASPPPAEPATADTATAASPSAAVPSSIDQELEARARRVLALLTDDLEARLRSSTPSVYAMFEELRAEPLTADRVRAVILAAQTKVDREELMQANAMIGAELSQQLSVLLVRVLSEELE